jgi:pimeloyl-ACP methyl ester carboxylesterase
MKLQLDGRELAYEVTAVKGPPGENPTIVFCPGFNSTMQGNKARDLNLFCLAQDWTFVRFDYSGHGDSGGDFADGSISKWLADTLAIIDKVTVGEVVIVGSSMGGWIALLAALQRPKRVKGLLLIACAADMTKTYRQRLQGLPTQVDGKLRIYYSVENQYDDQQNYRLYQALIDDGASHYLLDAPIQLDIPVRLVHGLKDDVIEWQRSAQVMTCLLSTEVSLLKIESADHRLSSATDLLQIRSQLSALVAIQLKR